MTVYVSIVAAVLMLLGTCSSFRPMSRLASPIRLEMKVDSKINVYKTKEDAAHALCLDIIEEGTAAIKSRQKFTLAIPGGSVLEMLSKLTTMPEAKTLDWTKVFLYYVNHKVVAPDDPSSTHLKAESIFLKDIGIPMENVAQILNDGTFNLESAAKDYQRKIAKNVKLVGGLPYFDYMLLGMGADGHVGSLYPATANNKEILQDSYTFHCLAVDKKTPGSITFSLPVMNAAREVRIVVTGEDKKEAALTGVSRKEVVYKFPAIGLEQPKWIMDNGAASLCIKGVISGLKEH
jgi:6-phosphogluconolactonase